MKLSNSTATTPKARYIVGKDAKTRARLQRLPTKARERVIARLMTGD